MGFIDVLKEVLKDLLSFPILRLVILLWSSESWILTLSGLNWSGLLLWFPWGCTGFLLGRHSICLALIVPALFLEWFLPALFLGWFLPATLVAIWIIRILAQVRLRSTIVLWGAKSWLWCPSSIGLLHTCISVGVWVPPSSIVWLTTWSSATLGAYCSCCNASNQEILGAIHN